MLSIVSEEDQVKVGFPKHVWQRLKSLSDLLEIPLEGLLIQFINQGLLMQKQQILYVQQANPEYFSGLAQGNISNAVSAIDDLLYGVHGVWYD